MVAPSHIASGEISAKKSSQATITVIRPSVMGSAVKFKVFADGQLIGKLGPKNYLSWSVDPGVVNIQAKGENKDGFQVTAEAGEEYFIKLRIKPGVFSGQADLKALTDAEGTQMLKKVKSPDLNSM